MIEEELWKKNCRKRSGLAKREPCFIRTIRCNKSRAVMNKIKELGFHLLPHALCLPDWSTPDFNVFSKLKKNYWLKTVITSETIEKMFDIVFDNR